MANSDFYFEILTLVVPDPQSFPPEMVPIQYPISDDDRAEAGEAVGNDELEQELWLIAQGKAACQTKGFEASGNIQENILNLGPGKDNTGKPKPPRGGGGLVPE